MATIIFSSLIGSRACGYATATSDIDVRTVYVDSLKDILSLNPPKKTLSEKKGNMDIESNEVEKFIGMLLKSNPNSLETLFSPIVINNDGEYFEELKTLGEQCVTRAIIPAYIGLSKAIIKRIDNSEDNLSMMKGINMLHRNLLTCANALVSGEIVLDLYRLKNLSGHNIVFETWYEDAEELMEEIYGLPELIPQEISDDTRQQANDLLLKIRLGDKIEFFS